MNEEMREFIRLHHQEMRTKTALHSELMKAFPNNPVSYQTVTLELRKGLWSDSARSDRSPLGRPPDEDLSDRIARYLYENPYASLRMIGAHVGASASTVRRHLLDHMDYKFKKTRWVPHILNDAGKKSRVAQSLKLITTLKTAQRTNFHFLLTGDESWFFYYYPATGRWVPRAQDPDEEQSQDHFASKVMITVFWGINGAAVIDAIPDGCSMNAQHFVDVVIPKIKQSKAYIDAQKAKTKLVLHMDNSPIHRSAAVKDALQKAGIETAPHPAYSPDLAPSDFYLFGTLKNAAKTLQFNDVFEIERWIKSKFDAISRSELQSVFDSWKRRLEACVACGGTYVE